MGIRCSGGRVLRGVIGVLGVVAMGLGREETAAAELRRERIDRHVEQAVASAPEGAVMTAWVGFAEGRQLYAREADRAMPVASAIKAAILVELYAQHADALDERPDRADIYSHDHQAFRHYRESSRAAVRHALGSATVDEIGRVMIGKTKAENRVYNGAANVAIALLGGPARATQLFHARDPAMAGLTLNRYMLADRTERGDNTATAAALAAVHRRLATWDLPGVDRQVIGRARDVLASGDSKPRLFSKGGSLPSDPLTRVRAGWWEGERRALVCVVMGSAPKPEDADPDEAYGRLRDGVKSVWDVVRREYDSAL